MANPQPTFKFEVAASTSPATIITIGIGVASTIDMTPLSACLN